MGEAKHKQEELEESGGYVGIEPADPEAAPEPEETASTGPMELRTAFLVLVGLNGTIAVCDDITVHCVLEVPPMMDHIYGAMAVLARGCSITETIDEERYETGFLVVVTREGMRLATNDINKPYLLDRHATTDDVLMAAPIVMKDIFVMEGANANVQMQMRTAAQMAEQSRIQKVSAKLAQRGIHVPAGGILRP